MLPFNKATKCIFVGYSKESKGYRLFPPTTGKIIISRDVIFAENATQPRVDCSKEPAVDQPDAFDTLLPLLQNVVFDGNRLTQTHGGNVQVLHKQQHAPNKDLELPSYTQIDRLQQPNVVENEQPNIVDDNADLQVISPHDLRHEIGGRTRLLTASKNSS